MIHTVHTLTIRRYGKIDETNDLSLLKRWWNPFPVRWFNVIGLFNEISQGLKSDANDKLFHEVGKTLALNKIMMLEALYYGIYNCIVLKSENDQWGVIESRQTNFVFYREKVKKLIGIDIKTPSDIESLKKELQRLTDKFNEKYKQDPKESQSIPFIEFAQSIFMLVEMDFNPDMKLYEFFNLITVADKKIKQLDKKKWQK